MENPTHTFKNTNLMLQLIIESQIRQKSDVLELAKD